MGTAGRWNKGFWKMSYDTTPHGIYSAPDKLFISLSPDERMALGFPGIHDPYWSDENLRLLQLRFPGFDSSPYIAARK